MSTTPAGSGGSPVQVVLPGDNRVRVPDSTARPYRWVGQLEADWSSGDTSTGTATLIGGPYLLTCAHNLYARDDRVLRARFRPALNRNAHHRLVEPYGSFGVRGFAVPEEYRTNPPPPPPVGGVSRRDITWYLWDVAVVRLVDEPPGDLAESPYTPGATPVGTAGQKGQIVGYCGDLDGTGCTQYSREGDLAVELAEEFVTYTMSTYHGDSGAAVSYPQRDRPWLIAAAVHVTGVPPSGPTSRDGLNFGPGLFDPGLVERLRDEADRHRL